MANWKHLLLAVSIAILPALAHGQPAQNWPERTVRLITSAAPGGSPDMIARLFAEKLAMLWKASVVVENRPGGDGVIAIQAALSANDGHTLLVAPSGVVTVAQGALQAQDLRPLSTAAVDFLVVAVPSTSPVRSLTDLIVAARQNPGALNWFASSGQPALAFGEFVRSNRLNMVFVPYKSAPEAIRDLGESRIHVSVVPLAVALPLAQAGKLHLIAITNPEPAPTLPTVPTALSAGHPELAIEGVLGFFAPASIPETIRKGIAKDVQAVTSDPEIVSRVEKVGQIARGSSSDEFSRYLEQQRQRWDRIERSQKAAAN